MNKQTTYTTGIDDDAYEAQIIDIHLTYKCRPVVSYGPIILPGILMV